MLASASRDPKKASPSEAPPASASTSPEGRGNRPLQYAPRGRSEIDYPPNIYGQVSENSPICLTVLKLYKNLYPYLNKWG